MRTTSKWNLEIPNLERPTISEEKPQYGIARIFVDIGELALSFILPETIPAQLSLALAGASTRSIISASQGTLSPSEAVLDYTFAFLPAVGLARKSKASLNKLGQLNQREIKSTFPKLFAAQTKNIVSKADPELLKTIEKYYGVPATNRYLSQAISKKLLTRQGTKQVGKELNSVLRNLKTTPKKLKAATSKSSLRMANASLIKEVNKGIRVISKEYGVPPNIIGKIAQKQYELNPVAFNFRGQINTFDSVLFHKVVQRIHYLDPKLAARKILTKSAKAVTDKLGLSQHGLIGIMTKKLMRIDVFKFWNAYMHAKDNKLVPLNAKKGFTLAYRPHSLDKYGIEKMVTLYFNPLNTRTKDMPKGKEPVMLYPMTDIDIANLEANTGAYYLDNWAVSRGGRKLDVFDDPISARLLNRFRYGVMQDTFSLIHHAKKDWKMFQQADFLENWKREFLNSANRLYTHKLGKMVAGRYGVAIARGFQKTRVIDGHKTTIYTPDFRWGEIGTAVGIGARQYFRQYESYYSRERRRQARWARNYHRVTQIFN